MARTTPNIPSPKVLLAILILVTLCCCCCFLAIAAKVGSDPRELQKSDSVSDAKESVSPTSYPESYYKVTEVVDGDTIKVLIDGQVQSIRLIGIDSPETNHPEKPVQCFGAEATKKMKELVENKMVSLKGDETQDDVDKYGRLLRYVYLEDGTFVNEIMVKEGYAYEYTYDVPYKFQSDFKEDQKYASENNLGLWGDVCQCADSKGVEVKRECSGCNRAMVYYNDWDCSTYTKEVEDVSCTSACLVAQPIAPIVSSCMYDCSGPDRDCAHFSTHAQAQEFFNCCSFSAAYDPMRLDNAEEVGNGIACEWLP